MLNNLLNDSKKQLASALKHKKHPFRYFTMTTIAEDGSPHSRMVVLRGFNPDQFTLTIHTDSRSNKVKELLNDPRAEFLFYDSKQINKHNQFGFCENNPYFLLVYAFLD